MNVRGIGARLLATALVLAASPFNSAASAAPVDAGAPPADGKSALISSLSVKYVTGASVTDAKGQVNGQAQVPTVALAHVSPNANGRAVIALAQPTSVAQAQRIAKELERDPDIEWAEPDYWAYPTVYPADPPSDPDYASQWNLWGAYGTRIGTSPTQMTPVWSATRGAGVTVAVIDTGIINHPDLAGQTVSGYDFVSSNATGYLRFSTATTTQSNNDGDALDTANYGAIGRDSNPLDPGDWSIGSGGVTSPSSWHGTHVAGTVAAATNNGVGLAGVAPDVKVQPIRALGWLGGLQSDIADAIVWASGGSVPGVPANATPAKVISLSLGSTNLCSLTYQSAINTARANGSLVVVAAGNEDLNVSTSTPANCSGVVSVAATGPTGQRAPYSNYGAVTIAGPGGDQSMGASSGIYSTLSSTETGPGAPGYAGGAPTPSYGFYQGTSMATPHVSAVAAMVRAAYPALTPDQVVTRLTSTVTAFAPGACQAPKTCGAGIVSAQSALPSTPSISSITPASGPTAGGQTVVITGANLTGATAVEFGSSAAASFKVDSWSQITAVTPPNPAGPADVWVNTPGGWATRASSYTYGAAPVVSSLAPNSGPTAGGSSVVITGSNFTGASAVTFGGTPASSFKVDSSTQITAVTPAHAAGAVTVAVTGTYGTGSKPSAFTFLAPAAAPVVSSVSPSSGTTAGGTSVVIAGSNFAGASAVSFGGTAATSFTVDSATQITAVTAAGSAGAVSVSVTTSNGMGSLASAFTFVAPSSAPTITYVYPNSGSTLGGQTVVITGSNLTGANSVTFRGNEATSYTVDSATQITAVTPPGSPTSITGGGWVSVTTPNGSATNTFPGFIYFSPTAPEVTGVYPSSGPAVGGSEVVITGTNFSGATEVTFGGSAAAFTVDSPTQITAVTPPGNEGARWVQVFHPTEGTGHVGPTYTFVGSPAPVISSVSPAMGPTAGGDTVVITGQGFWGLWDVTFDGVSAQSISVDSPTQITVVTPAHTAGSVNVSVQNRYGTGSLAAGFTYDDSVTRVFSVAPSSGADAGGTVVAISGTNLSGTTDVSFGGVPATSVTVLSSTSVIATAPAHAPSGPVDVVVSDGSGSVVARSAYQFLAPASAGQPVFLGAQTMDVAFAPDGTFAYLPAFYGGNVLRVRTADSAVTATIPVGQGAYSAAFSPDGTFAYVAISSAQTTGGLARIGSADDAVTVAAMDGQYSQFVDIAPNGKYAYVSLNGAIRKVSAATNAVTQTISAPSSRGVAISPDGSVAYVALASGDGVMKIRTLDGAVLKTISVGMQAESIVFAPDGRSVVVTPYVVGHSAVRLSTVDDSILATYTVGGDIEDAAIAPDMSFVLLTDSLGQVTWIRLSNNTVMGTKAVGGPLGPVAIHPAGQIAYVADQQGVVHVLDLTKVPGTVAWNPGPLVIAASLGQVTMAPAATTNSDGAISYAVTGGTATCAVDSATRVLSWTTPGTCIVTASAAETSTYFGASTSATFTISSSVPSAPRSAAAQSGLINAGLRVSWTAPATDGGSPITGYTARAWSAASGGTLVKSCTTTVALTCDLTALVLNTTYHVDVVAASVSGTGPASSPRVSVVATGTVPNAPAAPSLGNPASGGTVNASWVAPANNGSAITNYTVRWSTDNATWTQLADVGAVLTSPVTGLVNGTPVYVQVRAKNAIGYGPWSPSSAALAPTGKPVAPGGVVTAVGNASLAVTFNRLSLAQAGGLPVSYTARAYTVTTLGTAVGTACTVASSAVYTGTSTCSITGLTNGTTYYVDVTASNTAGAGLASSPRVSGVPGAQVPNAPAAPSLGNPASGGTVNASWVAPANNGSAITNYTVRWSTDNATWTQLADVGAVLTSPVTGLVNGTPVYVQVRAKNAIGYGPWSPSSAALAPTGKPVAPGGVVTAVGNASLAVTFNRLSLAQAGGLPVSYTARAYTVTTLGTAVGTACTVASSAVYTGTSTCSITGLTNGTTYYVDVTASNTAGAGLASSPRVSGVPGAQVPNAPAAPSLGNPASGGTVNASWVAPANNGSAITNYTVRWSTDNATWTQLADVGAVLTSPVTGLVNGTPVYVQVRAKNAIGYGPWSPSSAALAPTGKPVAPGGVVTAVGNASLAVTFNRLSLAQAGGLPVSYTARAYTVTTLGTAVGTACTVASSAVYTGTSTCSITGLTNGTTYYVDVTASNTAGAGLASSPRVSGVPGAQVPNAPAAPSLGNPASGGTVNASWVAPANNGSAITNYTVRWSTDNATWTQLADVGAVLTSPVTGLVNGTPVYVQVRAKNAIGYGPWSPSSAALAPTGKPATVTGVTIAPASTVLTVTWNRLSLAQAGGLPVSYTVRAYGTSALTDMTILKSCTVASAATYTGTSSCQLTALTNGKAYWIDVIATNTAGSSTPSTRISGTPA